MSKSKSSEPVVKAKKVKNYTRMQAERAIASGHLPPETFLDMSDAAKASSPNHTNYHVRAKAWKKMGSPIPEGWTTEDEEKFFASIHYNPTLKEQIGTTPASLMGAAFNGLNPVLNDVITLEEKP